MPQTLPPDFNTVLRWAESGFLQRAHWGLHTPTGGDPVECVFHAPTLLRAASEAELLAVAGFTELELGLPEDHGHGRWTYAQHAMAHALTKAGWTSKQTAAAIGKSRNAVIGLLYRETPWRTVADTRAGGWSAEDTAAVIHLRDVDKWKWRDIAEAVGWSECYCRLRYREIKNPKPEEPHCARV